MKIPVTLLYGSLTALITTLLGVRVSLLRLRGGVYLGKELPRELLLPVRAHGNAAEWAALGIVLLLTLELSGVGGLPLHLLGGSFFFVRLMHAAAMSAKSRFTTVSATLNYVVMLAMGGWALARHF